MKNLIYLILSFFSFLLLAQGQTEYFDLQASKITKNNQDYLALTFQNKEGWHTYWKNPGDAGLPIKVFFDGASPEELPWPIPTTYIQNEVLSYGYSGVYSLFYKLPKGTPTENLTMKAQVLVCNNICIPAEKTISFHSHKTSFLPEDKLLKNLENLPKTSQAPSSFKINFIKDQDQLALLYEIDQKDIPHFHKDRNLLTPYLAKEIAFKKESLYADDSSKKVYGIIPLAWEGEYLEPSKPIPSLGKLSSPIEINFLLQGGGTSFKTSHKITELKAQPLSSIKNLPLFQKSSMPAESVILWQVILFAFIGGLILNFMPCVLPVISIKLMGLVQARGQNKNRLLKHNLSYTLGVLVTFALLALVVHLIKSTGSQIGWGFQLQSPTFVFFITLVIFLMAINMFGLFEFKTPWGNKLGGTQLKESFLSDFLSGVISTILSTPCSAPFLGTALTFAFTTSSFNIYLTFLFIGLGLASPFILIAFFPRLISFLPRPGAWMQKFKYFLGFILLLTALWLLTLVFELTYSFTALFLTLGIMLCSIIIFLITKRFSTRAYALWLIPFLGVGLFFQMGFHNPPKITKSQTMNGKWKHWTPEKMKILPLGQTRFINFTASWCLTCKVNKKLILDTNKFYHFSQNNQIDLYEADWTHRDENISKWLAKYNVVGVPAYFIQKPNGEIIHLGELTSVGEIREVLEL